MEKAKDDMCKKNTIPDGMKEEFEDTREENYPSVFSNRNPSQDLKKLRGKRRSFQSSNNGQ